jgi:hypothetical protein
LNQRDLNAIIKALLLSGGAVAVVVGLIDLGINAVYIPFGRYLFIRPLISIAVGILALVTLGSKVPRSEPILLALIILGFIGGNAGALLIALGGIVGLVTRYVSGSEGAGYSSSTWTPAPPATSST